MISENTPTLPAGIAAAEPRPGRQAAPVWVFVLLLVLLFLAMFYFDQHSGWFDQRLYTPYYSAVQLETYQLPALGNAAVARGKVVYESVCALCHNPDGAGKPNQAPPLAGSEWVAGSPARLIRIPLYGLGGPITVKGQVMTFPSSMPAMGAALPDDDLAAVLTYMRQAWGNKAGPITAEQIKAVKAEVGNRTQPESPEELNALP
jgi:mono/diheme cytochrome c family protein